MEGWFGNRPARPVNSGLRDFDRMITLVRGAWIAAHGYPSPPSLSIIHCSLTMIHRSLFIDGGHGGNRFVYNDDTSHGQILEFRKVKCTNVHRKGG